MSAPGGHERRYTNAIVLIGSTDLKVLPMDTLHAADLVIASDGSDRRGVLKDRFGASRKLTVKQWDALYATIGHRRVFEWRDGKLHDHGVV